MQQRNTPIKTLIARYVNKKSGKVAVSRNEIKRRFLHLDWNDQKKIVLAFLDSSPTDRQWMYPRMLDLWDDSFSNKIMELWEEYHEGRCAWVVIRHLPLDYVLNELNMFMGERDYYFACKRLWNVPGFEIDRKRFEYYPNDYLHILAISGKTMCEEEADNILFGMLKDISAKHPNTCASNFRVRRYDDTISAISCSEIYRAVMDLERIGCLQTVNKFCEWNSRLNQSIITSKEYVKLLDKETDVQDELKSLVLYHIRENLDDRYKTLPYVMRPIEYHFLPKEDDDSPLDIKKIVEAVEAYANQQKKKMMDEVCKDNDIPF